MRFLRICLHGLALCSANLTAIMIGFFAYHLAKPGQQLTIQVPIAGALSTLLFAGWTLLIATHPLKKHTLRSVAEFGWAYLAALVWAPIVFVPLHYGIEGYLTAFSNVLCLWAFQLVVNMLAIGVAAKVAQRRATRRSPVGGARLISSTRV